MLSKLNQILTKDCIKTNEELAQYTTFRIGGPADYLVSPTDVEDIKKVILLCQEEKVPYYVIGKGSNLLVGDKGFRGVIIKISDNFTGIKTVSKDSEEYDQVIRMNEELQLDNKDSFQIIKARAGISLAQMATEVLNHSLTGFEFASGIPGTLGGAVAMNAGAYGGEIKDCILTATVMDQEGNIEILGRNQLKLGYRTSIVQTKGLIVLEATFGFYPGEKEEINGLMKELNQKRRDKQPLEYPSAGSTFKRPVGYYAGKLIMDSGLRGYQVGGAMVSEKHCGFVINSEHATAKDVLQLIKDVQRIVDEKFQVKMEPEVRIIGEFE